MFKKLKLHAAIFCSGLLLNACDKAASDDTSAEDTSTATSTAPAASQTQDPAQENVVSEANDVADLKLSSAFKLTLPDALEGKSSSALRLVAGKRSQEACQMGSTIKEITRSLDEVGNFFCHMEVEKDKIVFGSKIKITFEGQEFAKIWVDNSEIADNKIKIGFCSTREDGSSNELIEITGLTEAGPVGSIINKGSYSETDENGAARTGSYHRSVSFDMSEENVSKIEGQDAFSSGADKYTREVVLSLVKDGISEAALASKGTWQGQTFQERGRGLFDGTYGSATFESSGTHEGQTYTFSRLARFDVDGFVAAEADSDKFAVDGDLYIAADSLPGYLAADFTPTDLSGWVADGCPDFDEEVTLNPESAEHQACDGDRSEDHPDCWDQATFESGSELTE